MKLLDEIPSKTPESVDDSKNLSTLRFQVPHDSGRKNALGRLLSFSIKTSGFLYLAVTERGLWPSSENGIAFDRIVRYTAENGAAYIEEQACVLAFLDSERDLLTATVSLCLTNIWGFTLCNTTRDTVFVDHHEAMVLQSDNHAQMSAWKESMLAFGLSCG